MKTRLSRIDCALYDWNSLSKIIFTTEMTSSTILTFHMRSSLHYVLEKVWLRALALRSCYNVAETFILKDNFINFIQHSTCFCKRFMWKSCEPKKLQIYKVFCQWFPPQFHRISMRLFVTSTSSLFGFYMQLTLQKFVTNLWFHFLY